MISPFDVVRSLTSTLTSPLMSAKADTATSPGSTPKKPTDPNDLASKDIFLQLLIAQIKNQDPTKPSDSIQYITQLSQFTSTEQLVDIKATLKEINTQLKTQNVPTSGTHPQ